MIRNKQEGQAMMIATIFFLVVSITMIFGLVGPIVREQKTVSNLLFSRQSYFLAEAGLEDVIYRLKTLQTVGTTEILSLGGSTATTVTTDTAEGKQLVSTGLVQDFTRKIQTDLILGDGVDFNYGIQVGQGGFQLSNNAGVNGNVYSNGNISGDNGSFITGSALAVGTITGVDVSGTTQTGVSSQPFPITDSQITEWKSEAAAGGVVGSQAFDGTNNTLGPKKIEGNLNLDNGARLTLTGTIWVTGNIVLSNNSQIRLSSTYGAADGIVAVDGNSTLDNSSTMSGSGTSGSYIMLLSTSNSGSAITLSNNAGGSIFYAPNGTIQLDNNASVKQIVGKTISLANNAVIDYEQGIINANFVDGPGGSYNIDSWKEIE